MIKLKRPQGSLSQPALLSAALLLSMCPPNATAVELCPVDYSASINAYGGYYNGPTIPNHLAYAALTDTSTGTGEIVTWGNSDFGGSGAPTDSGYTSLSSTYAALAAMKGDGTIRSWGVPNAGGTGAPTGSGFVSIYSAKRTFAAIHGDGHIEVWGSSGGVAAPPTTETGFASINTSFNAFAALKTDGTIRAWGYESYGGSGAPTDAGYIDIAANQRSFAAIKDDGSISAWGHPYGGDGAPTDSGYISIVSTLHAFAALNEDKSITAWGRGPYGGDDEPTDAAYTYMAATGFAFAALRDNGTIYAWGSDSHGGSGEPTDSGYKTIVAAGSAFAALKNDGSITAWGDPSSGGEGEPTDKGYVLIESSNNGFAALKADGSISAWGNAGSVGVGAPTDAGYIAIASNRDSFAAMKNDGTVFVWGDANAIGAGAPAAAIGTKSIFNRSGDDEINCRIHRNTMPTLKKAILDQNATEESPFNFVVPDDSFEDPNIGDTLTLSVTSTLPTWLTFNDSNNTFSGTPLNANVGELDITVEASDGRLTVSDTFVLTVANTNDAPTVANPLTDKSVDEDDVFSLQVPIDTFADVDQLDTLTLTAPTLPAWLSFDPATRTLSGTPLNEHVGVHSVTVRATDTANASVNSAFEVTVNNTNDAPVVVDGIVNLSTPEDTLFTLAIPSTAFADPDVGDTLSYTLVGGPTWLTLSGNTLSGTPAQADVGSSTVTLRATDPSGLSSEETSFTLSVTEINDNAPVFSSATSLSVDENVSGVLYTASATDIDGTENLTFTLSGADAGDFSFNDPNSGDLSFAASPNYEAPVDADTNNTYDLTITASDGLNSTNLNLTITVNDLNDVAPVFGSAATHSAPEAASATGYTANATDADGNTIAFSISGGPDAAHFAIDSSSGLLTFSHPIDYETPQDSDGNNVYELQLRARDDASNSSTLNLRVTITDTNDNAPTITSPGAVSVDENTSGVFYTASATDPDSNTLTFAIVAGQDGGLFSINISTGGLQFSSAPDAENPTDSDTNNIYLLTLSVSDGTLQSTTTLAVTVLDLNDTAPTFLSSSTVSISEADYTDGYTAFATDPDSADAPARSLSYSIAGGADATLFTIDTNTGVTSFIAAPDFEAPGSDAGTNVYSLQLKASDSATPSNTALHDVTINLTGANDNPPKFTSAHQRSIDEGNPGNFYQAVATDADAGDTVTFSIFAGNDSGLFSIDPGTGQLSASAIDFENPGAQSVNNVYTLTLRASDTAGNSKDFLLAITVNDVNDTAPTITSTNAVFVNENALATGYTATATDPDLNDSLSWSFGGGADDIRFSIDTSSGVLTFNTAPDFEVPSDQGGTAANDNVYSITLRATDQNADSNPFTDLALTVTVNDLNDNTPIITSPATASIVEGSLDSPYQASATDADAGDILRFAIEGGVDAALFSINASSGELSPLHAFDREVPEDSGANNVYDLLISVTDQANHRSADFALAITVVDVDDTAPSFSSSNSVTVTEGSTSTGYTPTSTDPDSTGNADYTLSGVDAGLFTLSATTGELLFNTAPDFEAAGDDGRNNLYDLIISASDGATPTANTSNLAISVRVSNLNEAPVFSSGTTANVDEGSTLTFYTAQASDTDAGDMLVYSISGPDATAFTIDEATGALHATSALDFENPTDDNGDRDYVITVRATDGGNLVGEQTLTVTLVDVDEAPSVETNQSFSIGEFAESGAAVGTLTGSDPEGVTSLTWSLITTGSPFTLSTTGELTVSGPLDFEQVSRTVLAVRVSDGTLSNSGTVTINIVDENEITRLVNKQPNIGIDELTGEGVTGAVTGRETYYNKAIAAANPQPTTLAQLQAIIDAANATAEVVEHAISNHAARTAGGSTTISGLLNAGVNNTVSTNANAYQAAIANAMPEPTSAAELQAIIDKVNAVERVVATAQTLHHRGPDVDSAQLATTLSALSALGTVPAVPDALLGELAALIDRAETRPSTEAEIIALVEYLLKRAAEHPVVWLSIEQDSQPVTQVRPAGGAVTVLSHIANPVPGLPVSYDWQSTDRTLLRFASTPNPVTESMSFDPLELKVGEVFDARDGITRDALLANADTVIPVETQLNMSAAQVRDSDGDGVQDAFEGELEASVDASAANKLQTVRDNDLSFVMEAEEGVILRLGRVARRAQVNQSGVTLDHLVEHIPGATAAQVIESLPGASNAEVFDFEAAALPHAGASVFVVIPLQRALLANASYMKFHPASGWNAFIEDNINRISSAPALAGILGQCPPTGHSAYSDGLTAGHACVQLLIEDGGPNDADRFYTNGNSTEDGGINGNIKDPGAIVYTTDRANGGNGGELQTGLRGSGSLGWFCLLLLAGCGVRRRIVSFSQHSRNIFRLFSVCVLALGYSVVQANENHDLSYRQYISVGALSSQLDPRENSGGFSPDKESSQGWQLALGRRIGQHWSLELSYTDAGDAHLSHSTQSISSLHPKAGISYKAPALTLGWHLLPHAARLNAFARLGVAMLKTTLENTPDSVKMSQLHQAQLTLGAGLDWRLSQRFSLRLAHELYDKDATWTHISLVAGLSALHRQTPTLVAATKTETPKDTQEKHFDDAPDSTSTPTKPCDLRETKDLLVYFHSKSATVLADDEAHLFLLSQSLPSGTELEVSIAGHADARGASALNQQLSQQRANNVTRLITELKKTTEHWTLNTDSYGEIKPIASNSDPIGRAQNRRVELSIQCPESS